MHKITRLNFHPSFYWLIHPGALALYVFLSLLIFTPPFFQKYKVDLVKTVELEDNQKQYFHDLDGDGISEYIYMSVSTDQIPNIYWMDKDKILYDQWNLKGDWLRRPSLYFSDYDKNGYAEVYCFTMKKDSIFLYAYELLKENGLRIDGRFISKIEFIKKDKADIDDVDGQFFDINQDGKPEFVFTLFGGFSLYPRNTFAYDIEKDSLLESPFSASGFRSNLQYMDINGDGIPEICGDVYAAQNVHDDRPFPDDKAWLYVLNPKNKMNYLFPPQKVGEGIASSVRPCFYNINNQKYIAASVFCKKELKERNQMFLRLYDINGNIINEKSVLRDGSGYHFLNQLIPNSDRFLLTKDYTQLYSSNTNLDLKLISKLDANLMYYYNIIVAIDLNNDGRKEIIFAIKSNGPEKLIIYDSELSHPVLLDLPNIRRINDWHFSLKHTEGESSPTLLFQADYMVNFIKYSASPWYFMKYPTYILAYLGLFLMFWLLQKAQRIIVSRRYETEKQLLQQQMALSKKQMEPHFMLNMINNIGYMFTKDDKKSAMYYLGKFGNIMRRGLLNAQASQITLEEELEFVEDYLILQKKLMDDELDFRIEVEEIIEPELIQIPHSIIYTFVENAIKHGLRPKENDRKLEIRVKQENEQVKITIQDNGIGRQKSKELGTTDTGKGMEIVKTIIKGYNQLHQANIQYKVEDLTTDLKQVSGTKVEIHIG